MRNEGVDPAAIAALVAETPDEDLARGLAVNRDAILEQIFQRMGDHLSPDASFDTVVEWRISGREDGGHDRWQLVPDASGARVVRNGEADPSVLLTIDALDFLKLVTGNVAGPKLFLLGRLGVKGDLILAARLPGMFRIPGPSKSRTS